MMAGGKKAPNEIHYDDLSAILDNDIQLTSVDKEAEGILARQLDAILPPSPDLNVTEIEDSSNSVKRDVSKQRCKYCDFKAKSKKVLDRHEDRHAIKDSYYNCRFCEYMTYTHQRLIEHESKHTNIKPFECSKCDFKCRFRADLYKHQAKHSVLKKYKCPKCDFRTKWCRNIKHHLLKHSEDRPHSCQICGFSFKRLQDLKYHLYRHNDQKPIQCEECDFRCKTNYELKCHNLKHSSIQNFACTFQGCTKRTKTKSDLTKHMKIHNKSNTYLCTVCGKGFYSLQSINKHKDRHATVRNFKCAHCDKAFKTKPSLRAHIKLHSGVKPYQCDICTHTFNNKYNMIKHKSTHSGMRPFACPICSYGARTSDHLLAHIGSMHGDSYAYFCEFCKKPFKRYSQLQVHIKRMHNSKNSKRAVMLIKTESNPVPQGIICETEQRIGEVKRKRGRPPKKKVIANSENTPETEIDDLKDGDIKGEPFIPYKLATYDDGFRLPLASKGFHFNFEKTGKKPKSWFMDPENMHEEAAVHQRAYIKKKEKHSGEVYPFSRPKRANIVQVFTHLSADEAEKVNDDNDRTSDQAIVTDSSVHPDLNPINNVNHSKLLRITVDESIQLSSNSLLCDRAGGKSPNRTPTCNITTKIASSVPTNTDVEVSDTRSKESSHIKLVLKRKHTGTFQVTMNTSEDPQLNVANTDNKLRKMKTQKTSKKKIDLPQKSNKKENIKKVNCEKTKGKKTKLDVKESKSKRKTTKIGKNKQSVKNTKLKKKKVIKKKTKNNLDMKTRNKTTKGLVIKKNDRKKNGSQNNKILKKTSISKKLRPKTSRGKKKKLICSLGSKVLTTNNTTRKRTQSGSNKDILQQHNIISYDEEFPIKIEPLDDDCLDFMLTQRSSLPESPNKKCDKVGEFRVTNLSGSEIKTEDDALVPFQYVYESKPQINYTDHVLAWGLKETIQPKPSFAKLLTSEDAIEANAYVGLPELGIQDNEKINFFRNSIGLVARSSGSSDALPEQAIASGQNDRSDGGPTPESTCATMQDVKPDVAALLSAQGWCSESKDLQESLTCREQAAPSPQITYNYMF